MIPNLEVGVCFFVFYLQEMDEEDCERRRIECLDEMCNLEKQFTDLKDQWEYTCIFVKFIFLFEY